MHSVSFTKLQSRKFRLWIQSLSIHLQLRRALFGGLLLEKVPKWFSKMVFSRIPFWSNLLKILASQIPSRFEAILLPKNQNAWHQVGNLRSDLSCAMRTSQSRSTMVGVSPTRIFSAKLNEHLHSSGTKLWEKCTANYAVLPRRYPIHTSTCVKLLKVFPFSF